MKVDLNQNNKDRVKFVISKLQNSTNWYAMLNKYYLDPPSP